MPGLFRAHQLSNSADRQQRTCGALGRHSQLVGAIGRQGLWPSPLRLPCPTAITSARFLDEIHAGQLQHLPRRLVVLRCPKLGHYRGSTHCGDIRDGGERPGRGTALDASDERDVDLGDLLPRERPAPQEMHYLLPPHVGPLTETHALVRGGQQAIQLLLSRSDSGSPLGRPDAPVAGTLASSPRVAASAPGALAESGA